MRKSLWIILTVTFVALGAPLAHAQTHVAAYSLFGGTVTQAPEGNVFGVDVGDPILGEIFLPVYPPSPCFTAPGCSVTDFTTTLTIGSVVYPDQASDGSPSESVSFAFGILEINYVYNPSSSPCGPGTGIVCPPRAPLTLAGDQFFTTDCATTAVCGTLDFSDSQITPTPEPSTVILMASSLLGLAFLAKRRLGAPASGSLVVRTAAEN